MIGAVGEAIVSSPAALLLGAEMSMERPTPMTELMWLMSN
jgi:hypothetical protein